MIQDLPQGAKLVQQFLAQAGSTASVRILPESTATALDAAKALGVPVSHIGKSIVFGCGEEVIVAVVSGDQRVDAANLASVLNLPKVSPLRADDVKRCTGYVIGGVSPFGLPSKVIVVIDSRLESFEDCYVAAGHPKAIVRIDPKELVKLTRARVVSVAV